MSDSVPAPVADKGVLSRAIGVIMSPGSTFETVARYPRPAAILFLACLVLGLATGLPQLTERGRQTAVDSQVRAIERFSGRAVTPEVYAQMEDRARYGGYITLVSMFIFVPVVSLVFGALYWAIFNAILGGTASFKQVLAIVTHSQVIGALGAVAAAPIQYVQGIQTMAGPFNLGALMPMLEPDSFLANFLGSISFFTLWQIVISAIGLAVLYRRRTSRIAMSLIAVYLLLAATITAAVSSFMGR